MSLPSRWGPWLGIRARVRQRRASVVSPDYRTASAAFPSAGMVRGGRMGRQYRYTEPKRTVRVPFMQVRTRPPREALDLEKDLERAVERNEFGLEYQPIIDLQT